MLQTKYNLAKHLIDSEVLKVDVNEGTVMIKNRKGGDATGYRVPPIRLTPYQMIYVRLDGALHAFTVHQLVMIAAGHDLVGKVVNHLDGNKVNNKLSNLEVATRSENTKHFYKMHYDKMME